MRERQMLKSETNGRRASRVKGGPRFEAAIAEFARAEAERVADDSVEGEVIRSQDAAAKPRSAAKLGRRRLALRRSRPDRREEVTF
jgi:hypothetical protein